MVDMACPAPPVLHLKPITAIYEGCHGPKLVQAAGGCRY